MKRIVRVRMTLALIFASLILVSAHMSANAASAPMQLMTANVSGLSSFVVGGDYDFDLYNRTNGWVLNGFYTKENGKWSKNWLSYKIAPGKSVHMMWSAASDQGSCVVPFEATWDDYDKPDVYSLDWCKGIKSIYLKDDTFTVDYK